MYALYNMFMYISVIFGLYYVSIKYFSAAGKLKMSNVMAISICDTLKVHYL